MHLYHRDAGILDLQIAALGLLAEQTRAWLPPALPTRRLSAQDEQQMLQARDLF